MPVARVPLRSADAKSDATKLRFVLPYDMVGPTARAHIADVRRRAIVRRDEMLAYQRAQTDRDGARFFKDQARDALKFYRAACLLLPWVQGADLPGDCPQSDPYDWPSELFPALDLIAEGASAAGVV